MSYIVKSENPFINFKLTETGREKLSMGSLDFTYWAVGDSEIDYKREYEFDSGLSIDEQSMILRPKDRQPGIKYYVSTGDAVLKPLVGTRTVKTIVNNKADDRGFFSGNTGNFETLTTSDYIKSNGVIDSIELSGGTEISLSGDVGDFILLKVVNTISGEITGSTSNNTPIPYLWFKIIEVNGSVSTLDRVLPNIAGFGGSVNVPYFIYGNGDLSNDLPNNSATWDNGSLTFMLDSLEDNYPTWRMNNTWEENLLGLTGPNTNDYRKFGSHNYLGEKNYLGYSISETSTGEELSLLCDGATSFDTTKKSLSLIHFTNNSISNSYGEFLYINGSDNKIFKLQLPTIMYHRRTDSSVLGMTFIATGSTKVITDTDIQYVDLIEDPTLVTDKTPKVVGRVYPQFKTASIDNEEIIASMSYKSNRNWTLPKLDGKTKSSEAGSGGGVLEPGKTIYMTYSLDNEQTNGILPVLPCQEYVKLTNNTTTSKDIEFLLEDIGLLPYMRKLEDISYDGLGFYANKFNFIYQIVDNGTIRPSSDQWIVVDFTSELITTGLGETIDPLLVERQNSTNNGFILTKAIHEANLTNIFSITDYLNMPLSTDTTQLNFGDEKVFYGNIETYIGATIYKTIFNINLSTGDYVTTNPTFKNVTTDIRISEIGIYDSTQSLVGIAKMSQPILLGGDAVTIEIGMDF